MADVFGNCTFTHAPLTSAGRAIRLLDLQPSSDILSDIRCTLRHVDLDDGWTYKALSYVWGDPSHVVPILVDSKKCHVTVNCEAALRRLRETGETCLWIDAICINQGNINEKSTQIPLMRDIYASADEVIVWLGHSKEEQTLHDEARERVGFGLVEDLSACEASITDHQSFVDFALRGDNPISRWQHLKEIYTHSWFTRLWVHQEIALASKATVVGQHYSVSWDKLARLVIFLYERLDTRSLRLNQDSTVASWVTIVLELVQRDLMLRCLHPWFRRQANTLHDRAKPFMDQLKDGFSVDFSLLELLKATRQYKCFNPLDKVIAILGLVEDDLGLQPSYTQTVSELFTKVTWAIIQKQQSLEALCLAGIGSTPEINSSDFPSWVVDWRQDTEQPALLDYDDYKAAFHLNNFSVDFCQASSTLAVSGIGIDSILMVLDDEDKGSDFWRTSALRVWTDNFEAYPTGCNPVHAYIRTITSDHDAVDPKTRSRLTDATVQKIDIVSRRAWNEYLTTFQETMPAKNEDHRSWLQDISRVFAGFVESRSLVTKLRCFFVSSTGYMGIGPLAARDGDIICVIPGCNVPLMIRKKDEYYTLVGGCFIWGLMRGEGMEAGSEAVTQVFRLR